MENMELFAAALLFLVVQVSLFLWNWGSFRGLVTRWEAEVMLKRNSLLSSSELSQLLHRSLNRFWMYDLLRRLSVIAPLMGVILTYLKFYGMEQSLLQDAAGLGEFSGLYLGVAIGAILAIINQLLLWLLNAKWEEFCVGVDLPGDAAGMAAASAEFASGLQTTLETTITTCAGIVARVQEQIGEQTSEAGEVLRLAAGTQERIAASMTTEFAAKLQSVTSEALEVSARSVRETQEQISNSNNRMLESIQAVITLHSEVQETLQQVKQGGVSLSAIADSLKESSTKLEAAFQQYASEGLPGLGQILSGLADACNAVTEKVSSSLQKVTGSSEQFSGFVDDLRTSGVRMTEAAGSISIASAQLKVSTEGIDQLFDNALLGRLQQMQNRSEMAAAAAATAAEQLPVAIDGITNSLNRTETQLDQLDQVGMNVGESLKLMQETTHSLNETVNSHQDTVLQLRSMLEQIPAAVRMQTDGEVQRLIASLAEMTKVLGELVVSGQQIADSSR